MNGEFDIIKKYFTFPANREDVLIANGDDCASLSIPENKQLLITVDTLISGVHFPPSTSPEDIAYKAIMVNLSDLAAMGATPSWITLAITLPEVDDKWLAAFSTSLLSVLQEFNISLIGGDTTRGALSITIQAMGLSDKDKVLRRSRAKPGDKIYLTGDIGDAAIGLQLLTDNIDDAKFQQCINRLNRPEARVKFAEDLVAYAESAIDISDGLVADLGHMVSASQCGAEIDLSLVPVSTAARLYFKQYNNNVIDWTMLLTNGDDYELCFTCSEQSDSDVFTLASKHNLKLSCIGEVVESEVLKFVDENGKQLNFKNTGFKHF